MSDVKPFRLFVIAGEPSGDNLAASFIKALRARLAPRAVELAGIGGPALEQLGLVSRFQQNDIQIIGIFAVLQRLPTILGHIADTANAVIDQAPDLVLTVDVPDFSLRVAKRVRRAAPSIPIVHWVAPTVWAWRPGRAKAMKPHVDHILALLPFEPEAFSRLDGPPTTYVGHPLLDTASAIRPDTDEQRMRDNAAGPVILILPGSRRSEIRSLLPIFREAVRLMGARFPHARFVLPALEHLAEEISKEVAGWPVKPEVLLGNAAKNAAFRRARAALAASGTVTLELALAGVPMVGAYRVHPLEGWVARRLIKVKTVLLCNLVLGESVVPEFLQEEATAADLAGAMMQIVTDGPQRQRQLEAFARLDTVMALPAGRKSADLAVDAVLKLFPNGLAAQ